MIITRLHCNCGLFKCVLLQQNRKNGLLGEYFFGNKGLQRSSAGFCHVRPLCPSERL